MKIFWVDEFKGKAKDGLYFRSNLKDVLEKCEKQGINIVGIKYDGTFNLGLIQEKKE